VHARGFVRSEHFVPFPSKREPAAAVAVATEPVGFTTAKAIFGIAVRSEADWSVAAQFVRRFATAFTLEDQVLLAIGSFGDPHAHAVASRVERILEKAEVDPKACADIDVADYDDEKEWATYAGDSRWIDVAALTDRSPSALRRIVKEALA
jgi:hypothetical protein